MNALAEIRKDLADIIAIKKAMDYQNCYNNSDRTSKRFFQGECKQVVIDEGCAAIKVLIVDLAKKYQKERRKL